MKRRWWRARPAASRAQQPAEEPNGASRRGARNLAAYVWRATAALLVVATVALGPGSGRGTTAAAGALTSWQIAGQRTIRLGGQARIISLSPDGRWLAATTAANAICLYDVASMRQTRCARQSHGAIYGPSVAWSPDSAHLAFTENWAQYFENSDIWVMDAASGTLRDLTPDGGARTIPLTTAARAKRPPVLVDAAPAWSPDGKALVFARTVAGQHRTSLYRIAASGGAPVRIAVIAPDQPYTLYYGLRWLPDGRILFSLDYPNPTDPHNGLWILGADGGAPRELLKPDPKLGGLLLLQVTPDARTALVWYANFFNQYTIVPDTSSFALVDLASGARRPLNPASGARERYIGPYSATFSPDGAQVLYIYATFSDFSGRLALRPTRGGPESLLRYKPGSEPLRGNLDVGLGLNWARNDTIFVATTPVQGVLFTLRRR